MTTRRGGRVDRIEGVLLDAVFGMALVGIVLIAGCGGSAPRAGSTGERTPGKSQGLGIDPRQGFFLGAPTAGGIKLPPAGAPAEDINLVWYEATVGLHATVLSGGPGQVLALGCDSAGGPFDCEWTVRMLLHSTQPLLRWAQDLAGDAGDAATVEVGSFLYELAEFTAADGGEINGPAPELLVNTGASTEDPVGVAPGELTLIEFVLAFHSDAGDTATRLIITDVGDAGWADPKGAPVSIQFADNLAIEVTPGVTLPNPVITITPHVLVELCDDGLDNDTDELVDCNDPDCAEDVSCPLAPAVTCPESVTVDCDGTDHTAEAAAWVESATVDGVCGNLSWTNDFTGLSDDCGMIGAVTVTWTATDDCGAADCSATFTIADVTLPTVNGPEDLTIECDGTSHQAELDGWLAGVTAEDTCSSVTLSDDFAGLSADCAGTGSALVTWTATNECGQEGTHSATFAVTDTTLPTMDGPEDLTIECDGTSHQADLDNWLAHATAGDTCSDATLSDDFAGLSDDCGGTGSSLVTWTASDECGLQSTHSATFAIVDTTAPTVDGPEDPTVECDGTGNQSQLDTWLADVTGGDSCGGVSIGNDFAGLSDDCGETGSAPVTWTATDECGQAETHTSAFTIEDTTAPSIALNGPSELTLECHVDTYTELGAAAADTCDTALTSATVGGDTVDVNTPGTYVVTYVATDDCGNASEQLERRVEVVDTLGPEVTVGEMVLLWPPNHKYWTIKLSDCVTSVVDACDGELNVDEVAAIVGAYSDEPENANGRGDGNTYHDMVITGDAGMEIRAERQGRGNGRVYGVTFIVSDSAGNTTEAECYVGVPHDQSGSLPIDDGLGSGYAIP